MSNHAILTNILRTCGPVDLHPSFKSPYAWIWTACFPTGSPVAFMVTITASPALHCLNIIIPPGPPSALSPTKLADARYAGIGYVEQIFLLRYYLIWQKEFLHTFTGWTINGYEYDLWNGINIFPDGSFPGIISISRLSMSCLPSWAKVVRNTEERTKQLRYSFCNIFNVFRRAMIWK